MAGLASAAPLNPNALPKLPRQLNVKGSDVPVAGELLTNVVNALPVDASVSTDNDKRSLDIDLGGSALDLKTKRGADVDLGGAGLDIKNKRAVDIDLGGSAIDLKNKRSLDVDLGGAGVDIKRRALLDGLDVEGSDVPVAGEVLTNIVNDLPVDASVSALDNDKRALDIDLSGANVDIKNKRAVDLDLGGGSLDLKKKRALLDGLDIQGSDVPILGQLLTEIVNSLPAKVSVSALDNDKRSVDVDLGGANIDIKKRGVNVDLGGGSIDLKNKRGVDIDLGAANLDIKKRALLDGLDIQGSDVPLLGQLLTEIVNSLPANVSVGALDN